MTPGGGHTADSETVRAGIHDGVQRNVYVARDALAALARLEAAANRTASLEREVAKLTAVLDIGATALHDRWKAAEAARDAAHAALRNYMEACPADSDDFAQDMAAQDARAVLGGPDA